jgi:LPXTG-motif cell wall-anchored protein
MKSLKTVSTVFGLALMAAAVSPSLKADDWNRKTVITFSGPVEIPGVHLTGYGVLPAGTYIFKIVDSASDRHIVQIFSQDEKTVYATILAIPNYRLKATDKTVMTFRERPAGQPEALRAWFYPGKEWGEEFVYPKSKAVELAKVTNVPVLAIPVEVKLEVAKPAEPEIVAALKEVPVIAVKPTGEEVEIAQVVQSPPPAEIAVAQTPPAPEPLPATLPETASELPLIGLIGLGSLAVAGFLYRRNRSVS